jgi:hypothetical protein
MFVRLHYKFYVEQMWGNYLIKISQFILLCVETNRLKFDFGVFQQNLSTHPNLVKVEQGLTSRVFLCASRSKAICILVRTKGN